MKGKKTIGFNVMALVALLLQSHFGYVLDPEIQGACVIIINFMLRLVTTGPVKLQTNKLRLLSFILLSFFLAGCASSLPSVCDTLQDQSKLCDIAEKTGVRLEDIGNSLILVNTIAIRQGLYPKTQALEVLHVIQDALNGSYAYFARTVFTEVSETPGLLHIMDEYMKFFLADHRIMCSTDRKILENWIAEQVRILGGA